jgi:hypothetical protein
MSDLFNNPMVDNARASMTPEQLSDYQRKGEALYNTVEFTNNEIIGTDPLAESIAYIEAGLNSGLHPHDLTTDEVTAMKSQYGDGWYTKFGYTSINE